MRKRGTEFKTHGSQGLYSLSIACEKMICPFHESDANHFRKERAASSTVHSESKGRLLVLYDMGSGGSNFSRMG